jgi:hypothetical protein
VSHDLRFERRHKTKNENKRQDQKNRTDEGDAAPRIVMGRKKMAFLFFLSQHHFEDAQVSILLSFVLRYNFIIS